MIVVGLLLLLWPAMEQAKQAAQRMQCTNNLRQIGGVLNFYHDLDGYFPPAHADGHSWRVRIIPTMLASGFYDVYRFDEPWDSPWNHELERGPLPDKAGRMREGPKVDTYWMATNVWQCPNDAIETSPHCNYSMLVGPHAFGLPERGRHRSEITDDHATTIAVAETISRDMEWLEPRDFDVETMSFRINDPDRPSISSHHPGGAQVVFVDGHVELLSDDLPPEVLKAMITIDGGENIVRDKSAPGGYRLSEVLTD